MKLIASLLLSCIAILALAQGFDPNNRSPNIAVCSTSVAVDDPTVGIMPTPNSVFCNWKNAGLVVIGGIPARSTQCGATVNPSGITPPAGGDDYALITAAIASCTAGQVLQLGSGTFNFAMSELPIFLNKGITLRGSGSTVGSCNVATSTACWPTVLQTYDGPQPKYAIPPQCGVTIGSTTNCPSSGPMIIVAPVTNVFDFGWAGCAAAPTSVNPTTSNCGVTVAADVAQGATKVQVSDTTDFTVGGWVLIDEDPQVVTVTNPLPGQASIQASAEFLSSNPLPVVMRVANPDAGNCTYTFCVNRVNQEIHLVSAIGAGPCPGVNCTITFDSPLTMAFRQSGSHDARVYWPTKQTFNMHVPFLDQASVENMTINRVNGPGVSYQFCSYCWMKNVEGSYWIGGAVNFSFSARGQVTHSFLHDCIDCQPNGTEYPLSISQASTEILADDNIISGGGKGMVGRAAPAAVVAYNYADKSFYEAASIGDYWNDMSVNGSHYAGTHHFLFEGNWGNNCDGDETHGNAIYHTFFRNHCSAMRSVFVDPSNSLTVNDCAGIAYAGNLNTPAGPVPLRAAGPMAFNYWYAFVGNVLGQSGMQSCAGGSFVYNAIVGGVITFDRSIWRSGWTASEWSYTPDPNLDASNPFLFRNGNFDYVNSAIVDYATGYAHTFPSSFYRSSTPSFFGPGVACTYTWPWIDTTSGTPVKSNSCGGSGLPAKARADAGTPFVQP